ncbi:MAG: PilZ domain-containing protein [Bradyrhizobium sp.]|nr:PilZ domain-containing protein [Bradyrhizobium sp.]
MFDEQRKSRRRPVSYTAWIALKNGPHGCVLSDVSETGARIAIEDGENIPDSFVLLLAGNGSARRTCDVVWRERFQVGVRFRLPGEGKKAVKLPAATALNETAAPEGAAAKSV